MAALLVMGGSWLMISSLGLAEQKAASSAHNARVLADAKAALVGWVTANTLLSSENNPGRLPCPQAWGDVGTTNEGRASGNCASVAAGWLPWRTLGIPKPIDASGNQIWYIVSPGWHLPSSTASLSINSNTAGQLTIDGESAVAILIAPGTSLNIAPNASQIAAGCVARSQSSLINLPGTSPNPLDFLDCENGSIANGVFSRSVVDNGVNPVFNDQVIAVTTAEIIPGVEAAIAKRIERDIVPQLSVVYADASTWGTSTATPAFPFAAPFADPSTSSYMGQAGVYQGLLPFNYHASTCPGGEPRCSSSTITWNAPTLSASGGTGYLPTSPSCTVSGTNVVCQGYYYGGTLNISLTDRANSIATGLRTVNVSGHTGTAQAWRWTGSSWIALNSPPVSVNTSRKLTNSGALDFVADATLPTVPEWGYYYLSASRLADSAFADHPLLDSTATSTGWFVRNEWYRHVYYAIAAAHAPGGTLSCSDSGTVTCLQVTNLANPAKQRAIVALVGRALPALAQSRPSSTLQNYLDVNENRDSDTMFVQNTVNSGFNDRFISVSRNP